MLRYAMLRRRLGRFLLVRRQSKGPGVGENRGKGELTNESLPRDEVSSVAEKVDCSIRNLPHSPISPQRHPPLRHRTPLLPCQPLHPLRALYRARCNNITRYAPRAEFDCRAVGEGVDAGFGDGDVRLEGHGCVVNCGGDEDDAAACAGWGGGGVMGVFVGAGGGDEVGEGGFEGVVGAENVDVDDGFEGVGAELVDGGEEVACCSSAARFSD